MLVKILILINYAELYGRKENMGAGVIGSKHRKRVKGERRLWELLETYKVVGEERHFKLAIEFVYDIAFIQQVGKCR